MIISYVPIDCVVEYVPAVQPLLQKALDRGDGERLWSDIEPHILTGAYQLFICYDEVDIHSAVLTEIIDYPQYRNLVVFLMGGSNIIGTEDEAQFELVVEEFARHNKCKAIEVHGRKGWLRTLGKYDYQESYVTLIKEL